MIAKCADPERSQPFRVFRGGKLFIMDVDSSIWIRIASQCEPPRCQPGRFRRTGVKECGIRVEMVTLALPHLPTVQMDEAKPTEATLLGVCRE